MLNFQKFCTVCFGIAFCVPIIASAYVDTGFVTAGTVDFISSTLRTQKREVVNEEVLQIVTLVRQFSSEYDDFSNVNNDTIWNAIDMDSNNPYGGKYELSINPDDSRQFIVSITGLSKSDCEYFVARDWRDSVGYIVSDGNDGGAIGQCNAPDGENIVQIKYGE